MTAAGRLGFCRAGIAAVDDLTRGSAALRAWLEHGYHGEMTFMAAHGDRRDVRRILPTARSAVVVALAYGGEQAPRGNVRTPDASATWHGTLARYARGDDYHRVMKQRLARLADAVDVIAQRPVVARACVDSAPLLEHELAARAGVGFIGKSTLTIVPGAGSFVVLGVLLLDLALPVAATPAAARCGQCTACLDACPTGAFVAPYVLDARRCIAYLTIELRGPIPRPLRPLIGDRVFGCDECQTSCPFNAAGGRRRVGHLPELHPHRAALRPSLTEWLALTSGQHKRLVAGTTLARCSRQQLARNAAVALGNIGDARCVPALCHAATTHAHTLVRGHAAWALGRIGGSDAIAALRHAAEREGDAAVCEEIAAALAAWP